MSCTADTHPRGPGGHLLGAAALAGEGCVGDILKKQEEGKVGRSFWGVTKWPRRGASPKVVESPTGHSIILSFQVLTLKPALQECPRLAWFAHYRPPYSPFAHILSPAWDALCAPLHPENTPMSSGQARSRSLNKALPDPILFVSFLPMVAIASCLSQCLFPSSLKTEPCSFNWVRGHPK